MGIHCILPTFDLFTNEKDKSLMARQKIVAGNWKMNKTYQQGLELASEVLPMLKDEVLPSQATAILGTPAIHLAAVAKLIGSQAGVYVAAQNCHDLGQGAYTGEHSADMIASTGAAYVILGHSERRQYNHETEGLLAKKVDAAFANGLIPIFCCGESLETREHADYISFVKAQLSASLFHLSKDLALKLVIAYEPIWAIGTGKTASDEQAQEMHAALRQHLAGHFGQNVADIIPILYGGSVKPSNAAGLFGQADIDGALVGGASLQSRDFVNIVKAAAQA